MASAALEAHPQTTCAPLGRSWRLLVAARVLADGGATRSEIAKDLGQIAAHRLSPAEWRTLLEREIAGLIVSGLATESRNRLTLTASGQTAATSALGLTAARSAKASWADIRDIRLVSMALRMDGEPAARIKLLSRPDGLRAAVLQKTYNLPVRARTSPARLRSGLAVVALQRAFGNSIKDAMDAGEGLSTKAGRLLAGQLAQRPRDFGTDARLIATLAAESAGSSQIEADAVRTALLRRLVSEISSPAAASAAPRPVPVARPAPASDVPAVVVHAPEDQPVPLQQAQAIALPRPAAMRPDLAGFARAIHGFAGKCAEGWPGNRKAYISDVWQALKSGRPEWGLNEIEFKSMLAEAHRTGHVTLANADLKDRRSMARVQQSAVVFKNTVLHFVRVAD